jgi:hypothetical protein
MELQITTFYVLSSELLNALNIRDNLQTKMNNAEVMIFRPHGLISFTELNVRKLGRKSGEEGRKEGAVRLLLNIDN